jgi:sensor histidine kinase regulating citrate/malate metabolism
MKYREILSGEKTGRPIRFTVDLPDAGIRLWIFDFALVNIVENLLANSIRKVLEAERGERWIRLAAGEAERMNEAYVILYWSDNGPGVPAERKRSIFEGDSDKVESGDHGVGLPDVKTTIESAGGFIREQGAPGAGAEFVLGFPKACPIREAGPAGEKNA